MEPGTAEMIDDMAGCAQWMGNYVENNGMKGIVVGLSGGIDSSVITCLAAHAVGSDNVIGVRLPCETKEDMNTDAQKLAENLMIDLKTIDLFDSFTFLKDDTRKAMGRTREEGLEVLTLANIKARLRMTVLYAIANEKNYLVAGTGNRSELEVGYFTKYGDGGVDIEPLGNYYKGEVYKMAELMPQIPQNIKTKAPSADLYSGQTDEQELGMSYPVLDNILRGVAGDRKLLDEADIKLVEKVQYMIKVARHKNNAPPRYERI